MKLTVEGTKKNLLLKREEAWVALDHAGNATPTRADILKEAAKALKAKEDLVIVNKIFSFSGRTSSRARIFVYSKKEDIPKEMLEKMKKRMKLPEASAEEPKEEQKAGAPAEEKKEEPKKEEPKAEAPKEEKPAEKPKKEEPAEEKKE